MSRMSKATAERERIIRNVVQAINHHLVPLSDEIEEAILGDRPPEHYTLRTVFAAMSEVLLRNLQDERRADMDYALDQVETDEARAARDEIFGTMRERMRAYRDGLQASYGSGVLASYGMSKQVPITPHRLAPYAASVAMRLEQRPLVEPPRTGMPAFDTTLVAHDIRTMLAELEQALEQVGREVREDQLSRGRRDMIRAESWRTYQALTTCVEGLFELIERDDLAARVRLTARRRAGLSEHADVDFSESTLDDA